MKSWLLGLLLVTLLLCSCGRSERVVSIWNIAGQSVATVADRIAQEYDIHRLKIRENVVTEGGPLIDSYRCNWAVNFTSDKKMTLDELRPIAEAMAREFADLLFSDPIFKDFWEDNNATGGRPGQLSINDIGYKLTFWDEKISRPSPPYVAQVRFVEGEIRYYFADPKTQKLQEPIIEVFLYEIPQ